MAKALSISGLALIAAVGLSACGRASDQAAGQPPASGNAQAPAIVQPGAPGQASTVVSNVPAFHDNAYTEKDVEFMQGMIHHHHQALLMVEMISSRTKTPELIAMGTKIRLSQSGEIASMKEWLTARKQSVPTINPDGSVKMEMAGMAGHLMDMDTIQHHKGALTMVAELREAGGGKETNIGDFLNDVDNDQRMEIVRMYGLLGRPVEK